MRRSRYRPISEGATGRPPIYPTGSNPKEFNQRDHPPTSHKELAAKRWRPPPGSLAPVDPRRPRSRPQRVKRCALNREAAASQTATLRDMLNRNASYALRSWLLSATASRALVRAEGQRCGLAFIWMLIGKARSAGARSREREDGRSRRADHASCRGAASLAVMECCLRS